MIEPAMGERGKFRFSVRYWLEQKCAVQFNYALPNISDASNNLRLPPAQIEKVADMRQQATW
jgi:hypothetical protein